MAEHGADVTVTLHDPHLAESAPPTPTATTTSTPDGAASETCRIFPVYRLLSGLVRLPAGTVPAEMVFADAVEQVMRVSGSEDFILFMLAASPGTPQATAAVGKVLADPSVHASLTPGCPLLTYATGAPMDVAWRRLCPPAPGSLFAELQLYRGLAGMSPCDPAPGFTDPLAELEAARVGDLTGP